MTKNERELLKTAAVIIAEALEAGDDVRIPGFGLFRVRDRRIGDYSSKTQTHVIGVVYFRPFSRLREAVRNLQARCPAQRSWVPGDTDQCVHRDDHSSDHKDERGKTWS
tara:strand:- start:78 stop:404 length:327 start_codon:yes stop_codon:yes gene_type:complete